MIKDDVGYLTSPHAQHVDVPRQQVVVMAPQNISGEEIGAAWAPSATIIRHGELSGCYESGAMPSVIAPYAGFQSSLTLLFVCRFAISMLNSTGRTSSSLSCDTFIANVLNHRSRFSFGHPSSVCGILRSNAIRSGSRFNCPPSTIPVPLPPPPTPFPLEGLPSFLMPGLTSLFLPCSKNAACSAERSKTCRARSFCLGATPKPAISSSRAAAGGNIPSL